VNGYIAFLGYLIYVVPVLCDNGSNNSKGKSGFGLIVGEGRRTLRWPNSRLPAGHPQSKRVAQLSVRGQRVAGLEANLESDIAVNSVIGKMGTRRTNASVTILLRFETQLLSYRLAVKVYVLRADLIALNLSEGSYRIGDGATGSWGAVHKRTGVSAV
jgi:hypothetical protein